LESDALGTLPQGEHVLVNGSAANASNRYGDYAAMSVDPVDDCTFWFTGEYNASPQWSTRIGAFKFDACGVRDFTLAADPVSQATCMGVDVNYDIAIGSVKGYSDPVTLSASGNPAGTYTDFDVNPVIPEGDSILTVSSTGSAAAGEYIVEIMGVAPSSIHTITVGLELIDSSPSSPTLLTPADGAINVSLEPYYSWTPVDSAVVYRIEVATDRGFSNVVYTAIGEEANHTSAAPLDQLTEYFWRVNAENPCGTGAWSDTFSFVTADTPPILLVDDDDNYPDVRDYYTDALDVLVGPVAYDIWDTNNGDDEPNKSELFIYDVVIWFTGNEFGGAAGPGASGEAALAAWLDSGGCFMISSQDYYWDRGLTSFMQDYLGVEAAKSDVDQTSATGSGSIFSGLGPYTLDYPFANYSDIINPDGSAELAFAGDVGDLAVNKETDDFNSTYWGFPWEAVPSAGERQEALDTFLDWCDVLSEPTIFATPSSIVEFVSPDAQKRGELSVINVGGGELTWVIEESTSGNCDAVDDIAWLSVSPTNGTTVGGDSTAVEATIDSAGYGLGSNSGALCIQSNDSSTPVVTIPVTMIVADHLFAPLIFSE
jgi:hypothetical protein